MAQPFGNHPTLGEYLAWAREQGCSVQWGVNPATGQSVTRIVSPDGKRWVIAESGMPQSERLLPTTIARFDRRLGLKSPWFSIDSDE